MDDVYESLIFENTLGERIELSVAGNSELWEVIGRTGFSAPPVEMVTQRYANGMTKMLRRLISPRTVSVSMVVRGDTREERDAVFFDMIGKLFGRSGDGEGKLHVMRSDGSEVYLNCIYSDGLDTLTEQYKKFHRFTLSFYAPDPYFYHDLTPVEIRIPPTNMLTLSNLLQVGNYHKIGEYTGEGEGVIYNASQVAINPVIKLKSPRGNCTIENQTTGERIVLSGLLLAQDDTLIIDTTERGKGIFVQHADGTRSPAGQYLDWESLDFDFHIAVGVNEISFTVGAGSYTEGLTFEMTERFLSA